MPRNVSLLDRRCKSLQWSKLSSHDGCLLTFSCIFSSCCTFPDAPYTGFSFCFSLGIFISSSNSNTSKLDKKTVLVLPSLVLALIFPFHLLPFPGHPIPDFLFVSSLVSRFTFALAPYTVVSSCFSPGIFILMSWNANTSKLDSKTVLVLLSLVPSLIIPFHVLLSP